VGDASWTEAARFIDDLVSVLWIALAVAVGVFALAAARIPGLVVWRRLERWFGPGIARLNRRRAGLADDAGPWACPACKSVNQPTVVACYGCGELRSGDAPELQEAATNQDIFHRPPPTSHFDPARYRGPGVAPQPPPSPESPSQEVP
jgi:hypothetical protein